MADDSLQDLILKAINSIRNSRSRPSLETILKFITKTERNISVENFKTCVYNMIERGLIYNVPNKGKDSFYINNQTLVHNDTADIADNINSLSFEIEKDLQKTPTIESVKKSHGNSQLKSPVINNKNLFENIGIFVESKIEKEMIPFLEKLETLFISYEGLHEERKLIDAENINLKDQIKTLSVNDIAIKHLKAENDFLKKELSSKNEIIKILANDKKNDAVSIGGESVFKIPTKTARVPNISQSTIELSNRYNALSSECFDYNQHDNNAFQAEQNFRPNNNTENNARSTNSSIPKVNKQYDNNNMFNNAEQNCRPNNDRNNNNTFPNAEQNFRPNNDRNMEIYKRRTTTILGDSTIKNIRPKMVKDNLPPGEKVYLKSFSGATVSNMYHYSIPSLQYEPDLVIMHVGTNDLRTEKSPKEIANEIIKLSISISTEYNDIMVSSITARSDKCSDKANMVNEELKRLCHENKLMYIDNGNIRTRYHISNDKLHLNDNGSRELAANFANAIRL